MKAGNKGVVLTLLDVDAEVDAKKNADMTPLCVAVMNGGDEMAELLVAHGADTGYARRLRCFSLNGTKYYVMVEQHCTDDQWAEIEGKMIKKASEIWLSD